MVCDEQPRWTFGSGCTVSRVAGRIVICFSPPAINSSCAQACGTGALQGRIDCTEVANETLVSASFTSSTRPSLAVTNQSRPSHSGGGSDLAPESSHVTTLGLASAQSISHELEEAVAKTINNAKAPSTWENYSSRWRVFSKWCQDRNIDPAGCGLEFILCFLQSLLDSGRKVNTVRVYAAAISHFLNVVEGLSIGKHALVSQFLKGARRLHPERKLRSPSWDLPLVLQSLTEAPFEPLAQADLRSLSWKTVFLLAISSARRVGELHALSVSDDCLRWKTDYSGVSLWPNPAFLPKILNPSTVNQAVELAAFKPDPDSLSTGLDLYSLCPVRALRTYIERTQGLRQSHTQLFLCFEKKKHWMTNFEAASLTLDSGHYCTSILHPELTSFKFKFQVSSFICHIHGYTEIV